MTMSDPWAIDLAGEWRCKLDRDDSGADRSAGEVLLLPGSLQERGLGDVPTQDGPWIGQLAHRFAEWPAAHPDIPLVRDGRFRSPFCLTPKRMYVGVAWFSREIEIPESWRDRRVTLFAERAHWRTRVWVDEREVGTCDALGTPHEFTLFDRAVPGRHRLLVKVDNRRHEVDVGENSHSMSDHTQGNWNGLAGRIELRSTPAVWIDSIRVSPRLGERRIDVQVELGNSRTETASATVRIESPASASAHEIRLAVDSKRAHAAFDLPMSDSATLWSEHTPSLYPVTVEVASATGVDKKTVNIGLREVGTRGTSITLNGRPVYLRGTLECCIFPLTGYPPTDVESWRRIVRICKAHGLNHMRFHSYCPPEAAFVAADELGFFLQVECSAWVNQSTTLGDGKPIDRWLYDEADRIIHHFGNHPSFIMLIHGNEPGGERQREYLAEFIDHYRKLDRRRIYSSGAGWPVIPQSDYDLPHVPRLHQWGEGLKSRLNARPPETLSDFSDYLRRFPDRPSVSHEIGQWCVFPNLEERAKYKGLLEARNFDLFAELLATRGMLDHAPAFLRASGKLQALCYKEEVETALRTRGFGGFQLLDLHDFPGQGTALVGVLDPFWDEKGYISAAEFKRFCGPIVPLARLAKRVFCVDESFSAMIQICHFGPAALYQPQVAWSIVSTLDDTTVASGRLTLPSLDPGGLHDVGEIAATLGGVRAPAKLRLEVRIEGTDAANDWDLWLMPGGAGEAVVDDDVVVVSTVEEALSSLEAGRRVLWCAEPSTIRDDPAAPVEVGFTSIFWNTAWTKRQAPQTLGLLCDPSHPVFRQFPTDEHTNWQWWELIVRSRPMLLDHLAPIKPLVQVIDDWFHCRRMGLLVEAAVGRGRLVVCSADITHDLDTRPVAKQLRASVLSYMRSDAFAPRHRLPPEQLRSLLADAGATS
jgi:hypothetical protein